MKPTTIGTSIALWALWRVASVSASSHNHPVFIVEAYTTASAEVCDQEQHQQPKHLQRRILNESQVAAYREDGFIVVKGVLEGDLADRMAKAGYAIVDQAMKFPQFFSVIENGLIFNGGGVQSSNNDYYDSDDAARVFREVALYSKIPQIAAELMELDHETQNLRVLR